MEANEKTETPTPQTPFIELNINNKITPCEELENNTKNCENNKTTQSCCAYKKILRILYIIFMVIINYSPLVNGIIELILRKGNGDYCVYIGIEIGFYCFDTICLIVFIISNGTTDDTTKVIIISIIVLVMVFAMELLLYFSSSSYERDDPDEFVNSFGKFRIFSFFAIVGIDIISPIIVVFCCE